LYNILFDDLVLLKDRVIFPTCLNKYLNKLLINVDHTLSVQNER